MIMLLCLKVNSKLDFYNWNRVEFRYCDGSSYTGDVEAVDPITKVYYRGARAWRAVMDDLLAKGMKDTIPLIFTNKNIFLVNTLLTKICQMRVRAVLAGCSAGGLGAILQCDNFRVKCLSDGGFFINTGALYGMRPLQEYFAEVVTTHGSAKNLPEACTSIFRPELCMLPRHAARDIQTPLFLLNSAYDSSQMLIP